MESSPYKTVKLKNKNRIAGLIAPAILIFIMIFFSKDSLYRTNKAAIEFPSNIAQGDFILRKGKGFVSNTIIKLLNDGTNISHCGVIILDSIEPFGFSVIHAVSDHISNANGMQKTSLVNFMQESVPGTNLIVRHRNTNPEIARELTKDASLYLKQKRLFDHSFDITNHDAIFCTELLYMLCKDRLNDTVYKESIKPYYSFAVFQDTGKFVKIWPKKSRP